MQKNRKKLTLTFTLLLFTIYKVLYGKWELKFSICFNFDENWLNPFFGSLVTNPELDFENVWVLDQWTTFPAEFGKPRV